MNRTLLFKYKPGSLTKVREVFMGISIAVNTFTTGCHPNADFRKTHRETAQHRPELGCLVRNEPNSLLAGKSQPQWQESHSSALRERLHGYKHHPGHVQRAPRFRFVAGGEINIS